MKYIMTNDQILIKTYSAHRNKRNLKVHITEVKMYVKTRQNNQRI